MTTATKEVVAKDLLRLAGAPLDEAPAVRAARDAAEASAAALGDLQQRERRARALTDPNLYRSSEHEVDRAEILSAQLGRPLPQELASAEIAAAAAKRIFDDAMAAEQARRLEMLRDLRQTRLPVIAAKYQQLIAEAADLAAIENAFAQRWPDACPDRYASALASPEKFVAWISAARTEGIKV